MVRRDAAKTVAERVAEQKQHVERNTKDDGVLELTEAYHNIMLKELGADVQRLYQRRVDTFPVATPVVRSRAPHLDAPATAMRCAAVCPRRGCLSPARVWRSTATQQLRIATSGRQEMLLERWKSQTFAPCV